MATKHSDHEFSKSVHSALHEVAGSFHEQLHAITRQEEKLKLQKALLKATAAAELTKLGPRLKLSNEAVAKVSTLNW